jgi:hypothetical protein
MIRKVSCFHAAWLGAAFFATVLAGCDEANAPDTAEEGPDDLAEVRAGGEDDAGADVSDGRTRFLHDEAVLAYVEDPHGGFVAVMEHPDRPDDFGLAVLAVYPHPPLVAPAFAEHHDALETFVALLEPTERVPDAIRSRLSTRQLALADDAGARSELRLQNKDALAKIAPVDGSEIVPYDATVCSVSFRNWADGVFGGDSTCGQLGNGSFNLTTTNTSRTYGAPGYNFRLGQLDHGECENGGHPDGWCAVVTGNLSYRRQRGYNVTGNGEVSYPGHRQHYGLANCAGNGAVSFDLVRGGSTSSGYSVGVGGMLHYYWGTDLPSTRSTIDLMSYGIWNDDQGASGSSYVDNRIVWTNNAGADDKIIVCGDVQQSIAMTANDFACGPNYTLCTGDGDCDSACYDIVGY